MAVVKVKSDLFADRFADEPVPDPARARGRPIVIAGRVENAATDSNGSMYLLAELPSDCILAASTAFQVENDGFAAIRIGTRSDVDALVSVAKSAGNVVSPVAQFSSTFHGKPLWEALGMASDPGGTIGIWKHAVADAAAAGHMLFEFHYRYR